MSENALHERHELNGYAIGPIVRPLASSLCDEPILVRHAPADVRSCVVCVEYNTNFRDGVLRSAAIR